MREQESWGPIGLYALIIVCALALVGWRFVAARVETQRAEAERAAEAEQQAQKQKRRELEEARHKPERPRGRAAREGR
jgi:hypothetical protein